MSGVLTFDEAVSAVQRTTGCGYERAVELVRQDGRFAGTEPRAVQRDDRVAEKTEQVEVRKLFIGYGFLIYQLSQPRATKQTPGLFDLWCVHTRLPLALWFDVKRQVGGVLSSAQKEFQERTRAAGIRCESGDRYAVVELLIEMELAVRGAGAYGIEPIHAGVSA